MNHKRLKLTQSATKNPGQMSEASSIPRVEAQAAATQWTAVGWSLGGIQYRGLKH